MATPIHEHGRTWYLPTSQALNSDLYTEYLKGRNCDCEIISQEGTTIRMHSSVLLASAHSPLISSDTKLSKKVVLILNEWDVLTIRAFVEYLYLGYDKFLEKFGQPEGEYTQSTCTIPIFALIYFAYKYEQARLFECCRKIILNVTTKEDASRVLDAANKCQNYFLHEHYESLIK